MRRHYLVSYDIACPVRLRRVHKTVRDFGDPLQFSVFACQLTKKDRALLEARLLEIVDSTRDQVLFVNLGPATDPGGGPPRCHGLGRPLGPPPPRVWVV